MKAIYVKKMSNAPPFIHDLVRLAEKAHVELAEDQKDILDTLSTFNLRARYDDYKMEFHRKCTKEFTKRWVIAIEEFRERIKQMLEK